MTNYVVTRGKVMSSKVAPGQSISNSVSGQSSHLKEMYFPEVTYEYTVDKQSYQNDRFWQDKVKINQIEKIEALIKQYSAGANIDVFYNPSDPSESFLQTLPEITINRKLIWGVVAGIVIILGIVWLILSSGGG